MCLVLVFDKIFFMIHFIFAFVAVSTFSRCEDYQHLRGAIKKWHKKWKKSIIFLTTPLWENLYYFEFGGEMIFDDPPPLDLNWESFDQDFYLSKMTFLKQNILVLVCLTTSFHIFLVLMTNNILGIKY